MEHPIFTFAKNCVLIAIILATIHIFPNPLPNRVLQYTKECHFTIFSSPFFSYHPPSYFPHADNFSTTFQWVFGVFFFFFRAHTSSSLSDFAEAKRGGHSKVFQNLRIPGKGGLALDIKIFLSLWSSFL